MWEKGPGGGALWSRREQLGTARVGWGWEAGRAKLTGRGRRERGRQSSDGRGGSVGQQRPPAADSCHYIGDRETWQGGDRGKTWSWIAVGDGGRQLDRSAFPILENRSTCTAHKILGFFKLNYGWTSNARMWTVCSECSLHCTLKQRCCQCTNRCTHSSVKLGPV